MSVARQYDREFVRTFFTTPTAVEGEDDSAKMLRSAAQLRGIKAPDVWVPDNEDATAPSMREEGAQNIREVVAEHGAEFPGEIHPRVVWHRESPSTRYQGFQQMLTIADPDGIEWVLSLGIFLAGCVLSLLTGLAWRREHDRKLLLVTVAYALFALRGLAVLLAPVVEGPLESGELHPSVLVFVGEVSTHLSPLLVLAGLVLFFVAFTRS